MKKNSVSYHAFFLRQHSTSPSCLIVTPRTGIEYSTCTNDRYSVFIRTTLVLKPHNLLTADLRMGRPEINLTHNWGIK